MTINPKDYLFPFDGFRPKQDELLEEIYKTLQENKTILVSAPTGVGKTISGLGPSLSFALKNNLKIIYLTSRKTQVNQVLETIKKINIKFGTNIKGTGFIGKQDMCVHEKKPKKGIQNFCDKKMTSEDCVFYLNYKGTNGSIPEILTNVFSYNIEEYIEDCKQCGYCPHKISYNKIKYSNVIIGDYNYFFQKSIREIIFKMGGFDTSKTILIVDEAHNLPSRVRNMYSKSLSSQMIKNAFDELNDFKNIFKEEEINRLNQYFRKIENFFYGNAKEKLANIVEDFQEEEIKKEVLFELLKPFRYIEAVNEIRIQGGLIEGQVEDEEFESNVKKVGDFLAFWIDELIEKDSFFRYVEYKQTINLKDEDEFNGSIHIKNLDPSEFIRDVVNQAFGTVMLSATLEPIEKYKYDLGLNDANIKQLPSPFKLENVKYVYYKQLSSSVPNRDNIGLNKMKNKILKILTLEKNTIIFFPSYDYLDLIYKKIFSDLNQNIYRVHVEVKEMIKDEKEFIINSFKDINEKKQLLFAVAGGNFYEGLDLPGKNLEVVVLAGFPYPAMSLVNKALENYYFKKKINHAKEFTYIFPAISLSVQAGGRCIRDENDRGLIFLLDKRFYVYKQYLPEHWVFTYELDFNFLKKWINHQ